MNERQEAAIEKEVQVTKDAENVVELEVGGNAKLIKQNVSYVIVEYDGEKCPVWFLSSRRMALWFPT